MSTTVTLNGVTYTYETDFIGSDGYAWTKPKSPASTGNVLFSLLNDFLADVVLEKAGIASVSGVSPSSAGNVLISDGSNWVRSHSSGVTALLDALTVSGTSSLQAVTATSVSAVIGAGNDATLTLNQAGVTAWTVTNRATSGLLAISQGGNDWFTIAKTTGVASFASSLTVAGAWACNGATAQTKQVSGGTLAGVIAALVANGILSS